MAAVPIQIDGVLWHAAEKRGEKVTLMGNAFIVGLGPGGGPIVPPDTTPPGPDDPHPEHPIVLPPDQPPDPPTDLPNPLPPSSVVKEAPSSGGWGYYTDAGSNLYPAYRPGAGGAGPKG